MKLSDLKEGQGFKLATSDNVCIFVKKEVKPNQIRTTYTYECVNSGNIIETFNDYEIVA